MPTIIWAERNNYSSPTQVEAVLASMVAALRSNSHYLMSCTGIRELHCYPLGEFGK
jgi:hypothetical protein